MLGLMDCNDRRKSTTDVKTRYTEKVPDAEKNPNSIFHLYKWDILCFQIAINLVTINLLYTYTDLVARGYSILEQIDDLIPCALLWTDFFLNMIPFVGR
jgi:hypothetical protein